MKYLGLEVNCLGSVTFDKNEPAHMGPNYEIRWDYESKRWGREHHALCAGGYRVPVLHCAYADMKPAARRKALLEDAPVAIGYLARWTWLRLRNEVEVIYRRVHPRLRREDEQMRREIAEQFSRWGS
jgi:hypothetical protein